jgi:hypoxanthine phosphoribosyltransferase
VISPAYQQEDCIFIDWALLEKNLDVIVNEINSSNVRYDGVIGIKTGGALISDYISNKLGLPNYKMKVSTTENNCDKTAFRSMKTHYDLYFRKRKKEYMVCEKIQADISNKKMILIDESVFSGGTLKCSIDYLLDEKNVSDIYACCIYAGTDVDYRNVHLRTIKHNICLVWPWGYDN